MNSQALPAVESFVPSSSCQLPQKQTFFNRNWKALHKILWLRSATGQLIFSDQSAEEQTSCFSIYQQRERERGNVGLGRKEMNYREKIVSFNRHNKQRFEPIKRIKSKHAHSMHVGLPDAMPSAAVGRPQHSVAESWSSSSSSKQKNKLPLNGIFSLSLWDRLTRTRLCKLVTRDRPDQATIYRLSCSWQGTWGF